MISKANFSIFAFLEIEWRKQCFCFILFKAFCLFIWETQRERVRTQVWAEGPREKQTSWGTDSAKEGSMLGLWDHGLSGRQPLNRLSHSRTTPKRVFLNYGLFVFFFSVFGIEQQKFQTKINWQYLQRGCRFLWFIDFDIFLLLT